MPFGVDEAGKGPVLGPMVAAAVWIPDRSALPDGIGDSKRLPPRRRTELAERLRANDDVRAGIATIDVRRIDDPETDMNTLAVAAHAEAIEDVLSESDDEAGARAERGSTPLAGGHCDACDIDADRFARRVADACDLDVNVRASHGADDEDPLVGAASVIAKVERDAEIEALGETYGEVGSGYPSDPTTREFLATYVDEHGAVPSCARESWSTCSDLLAAAEQRGLGDF